MSWGEKVLDERGPDATMKALGDLYTLSGNYLCRPMVCEKKITMQAPRICDAVWKFWFHRCIMNYSHEVHQGLITPGLDSVACLRLCYTVKIESTKRLTSWLSEVWERKIKIVPRIKTGATMKPEIRRNLKNLVKYMLSLYRRSYSLFRVMSVKTISSE